MPKYYCDYCKSYLTHDTMSVRRSHLAGKNHIRLYCNHFETKVKQQGQWKEEMEYTIDSLVLTRGAPGVSGADEATLATILPPPPSFSSFPNPPPGKLNNKEEYQMAISNFRSTYEE